MATKKREPRIFLLGNEFVIVLNKEILSKVEIPEERLKEEIEKQIHAWKTHEAVSTIFMKAVTNASGIPFTKRRERIIISDMTFEFNIRDNSIYKKYEQIILDHEVLKEKVERQKKSREAAKNQSLGERELRIHKNAGIAKKMHIDKVRGRRFKRRKL